MKPSNRWVWMGAIAIAAIILLTLLIAPSRDRLSSGSTFSRSPSGYGAWYAFMAKRGTSIQRWQQPFQNLPSEQPITLLQVRSDPSQLAMTLEMQQWIAAGNTLVVLGVRAPTSNAPFHSQQPSPVGQVKIETRRRNRLTQQQKPFPHKKDTTVVQRDTHLKPETNWQSEDWMNSVSLAAPRHRTTQNSKLKTQNSASPPLPTPREDSTLLLGDRYGAVVWQQKYGQGTAIFATTPYLAANAYQDEPGNYPFLATLLEKTDQPIWVDEYIHGYKDETALNPQQAEQTWLTYLAKTPLLLIGVQLGTILLVLTWAQNRRFGLPQTVTAAKINNSKAYMQALAGVLQKAGRCEFILQVVGQAEQRRLQQALGLGEALLDRQTLLAAWVQQTGRPAAELQAVLPPPVRRQLSEAELLQWLTKWRNIHRHLHRRASPLETNNPETTVQKQPSRNHRKY